MHKPEGDLNHQIRLSDGRLIGYAEYGDPAGEVVFYFHGWPGSRLEPRLLDSLCSELRLRLVAPDRPGYGLSEFQTGRTLLDWPMDVCALADHLGTEQFALLGVSGGGPYAIACAAMITNRLTAVLLVGSVGPAAEAGSLEGMVALNRWLLTVACKAPWLAERLAGICMRMVWNQGRQVIPAAIEKRLPPPDKQVLGDDRLREALIESSVEALREGMRGAVADRKSTRLNS